MKKILWVLAVWLILLLCLVYRQLVSCHRKAFQPKISIPVLVQENLVLGSLLIQ